MSEKKFYAGVVDIFDKGISGNPEKSCEIVISDTVPEITHDSWFFRYYANFHKYETLDVSSQNELMNERRIDCFWNMLLKRLEKESTNEIVGDVYELDEETLEKMKAIRDDAEREMTAIRNEIVSLSRKHLETACNANGRMRELLEKDGRVIDGRELVEMTGEVALLEHNAVANPKVRNLFGLKELGWGKPQNGNSDEKQDKNE